VLWLLRHADAADGSPDADRPLTELGVAQARAAGRALERLGANLELCISSPKRRAIQTAELACETLGVSVTVSEDLAGGPFEPEAVAAGLEHVMLVGHEPSISLALHDATGAQVRMRKGGLAAVKKGELIVLLRPAEIEAIAGLSEVIE
jgi:phosphohistidine phosphatase